MQIDRSERQDHDELQQRGNPLVDGTYKERAELSPNFVGSLDAMVSDPVGMPADPLLCAQDVPESFETGEATVAGDSATVPVTTSFSGHGFTVVLVQSDGAWLIDGVDCGID